MALNVGSPASTPTGAAVASLSTSAQGLLNPVSGKIDLETGINGNVLVLIPNLTGLLEQLIKVNTAILYTLAALNHEDPIDPYGVLSQLDFTVTTA